LQLLDKLAELEDCLLVIGGAFGRRIQGSLLSGKYRVLEFDFALKLFLGLDVVFFKLFIELTQRLQTHCAFAFNGRGKKKKKQKETNLEVLNARKKVSNAVFHREFLVA